MWFQLLSVSFVHEYDILKQEKPKMVTMIGSSWPERNMSF